MPAFAFPSAIVAASPVASPSMRIPLLIGIALVASSVAVGALFLLVRVIPRLRRYQGRAPVDGGVSQDTKVEVDIEAQKDGSLDFEEEEDIATTLDIRVVPSTTPALLCQPERYTAVVDVLDAIEMHTNLLSQSASNEEVDVTDVATASEEPFPLPSAITSTPSLPTVGLISAFKADIYGDDADEFNDNDDNDEIHIHDTVLAVFNLDIEVLSLNAECLPMITNGTILAAALTAEVELCYTTPPTITPFALDEHAFSPLHISKASRPSRTPLVSRQPPPASTPVTTPIRPSTKGAFTHTSSSLRRIPAIKGRPRPPSAPTPAPTPPRPPSSRHQAENIATPRHTRNPKVKSSLRPARNPHSTIASPTITPLRSTKYVAASPLSRSVPRPSHVWR
ncbi:hypothetical protein ONZ45_g6566 [Pleurotus djamor]|nr:hypothetical protein ONZ45_g6566 [Pleurotus djamor]